MRKLLIIAMFAALSAQAQQVLPYPSIWATDTTNTVGNSLTLKAVGATSGATDKLGGPIYLYPGESTGNAAGIAFQISGTPYQKLISIGYLLLKTLPKYNDVEWEDV